MSTDHPITPPPELVDRWLTEWASNDDVTGPQVEYVATQASRWGADQELEACCKWLKDSVTTFSAAAHLQAQRLSDDLRASRRPKQQSFKQRALEALDSASYQPGSDFKQIDPTRLATIRRALEALPDD